MKNQKMTRDEFAKFMADIILSIKTHNFDTFYDIAHIMRLDKQNRGLTEQPTRETFYLFTRDTGCDFIVFLDGSRKNDMLTHYEQNNQNKWEITFCWNCDYFYNSESFATVTKIK
jgi:hypothetical protein